MLKPVASVAELPLCTECLVRFDFKNGLVRNYLALWGSCGAPEWTDEVPADGRFHRMMAAGEAIVTIYPLEGSANA